MKSILKRLTDYIFNTSISLQDRSFVVFSCLVLVALYSAIPLGMIMREPLGATLSTLGGAVGFSLFVYFLLYIIFLFKSLFIEPLLNFD